MNNISPILLSLSVIVLCIGINHLNAKNKKLSERIDHLEMTLHEKSLQQLRMKHGTGIPSMAEDTEVAE